MPRLPSILGKAVVKALSKIGNVEVRQRGSHIRLTCVGKPAITVPNHKAVGRGLLRKILRDADLSLGDFMKLV